MRFKYTVMVVVQRVKEEDEEFIREELRQVIEEAIPEEVSGEEKEYSISDSSVIEMES